MVVGAQTKCTVLDKKKYSANKEKKQRRFPSYT